MMKSGIPISTIAVVSVAIIGIAVITTGIFFVSLGTAGTSTIRLFGVPLDTQTVGVVFVFIGLMKIIFAVRHAIQKIQGEQPR